MILGLEIGGERTPAYPEYTQLDNDEQWHPDVLGDAVHVLQYFDLNHFDHVYARNVLEHFSWRDTTDILQRWLMIVKPGGTLEVVVPDTVGIINDYLSQKNDWSHCCERLAGTQDYPGNTHLAFFTFDTFHEVWPEGIDLQLEQTHLGGGITAKAYKYGLS